MTPIIKTEIQLQNDSPSHINHSGFRLEKMEFQHVMLSILTWFLGLYSLVYQMAA